VWFQLILPRRKVHIVKVTSLTIVPDLSRSAGWAHEAELLGFDGVFISEGKRDPFLSLSRAVEVTEHIELGTGVAIAFARSPMVLAYTAQELQQHSRGRFVLGLGPQVKHQVERRYSAAYSPLLTRMREYVHALRAIWDCWNLGKRLDFRGQCYQHNLMIPMFTPPPHSYGHPKIFLAVTGPKMAELAGQVADGVIVHAIASADHIRQTILPALARGLDQAGRHSSEVEVVVSPRIATGADDAAVTRAARAIRRQLAFYASTPEYLAILQTHGRGELQPQLTRMAVKGQWELMGEAFDEDLLAEFAIVGTPSQVPGMVRERYGHLCTGISVDDTDIGTDLGLWASILRDLRREVA
jgi:probable F420-dependent oxidoreductase